MFSGKTRDVCGSGLMLDEHQAAIADMEGNTNTVDLSAHETPLAPSTALAIGTFLTCASIAPTAARVSGKFFFSACQCS